MNALLRDWEPSYDGGDDLLCTDCGGSGLVVLEWDYDDPKSESRVRAAQEAKCPACRGSGKDTPHYLREVRHE